MFEKIKDRALDLADDLVWELRALRPEVEAVRRRASDAWETLRGRPLPRVKVVDQAYAAGFAAGYRAALTNSDLPAADHEQEWSDA